MKTTVKTLVATLALAFASSLVAAAPNPPTPPAPPPPPDVRVPPAPGVCADVGQVAFEIDVQLAPGIDPTSATITTSTTKLYWTGAWTFAEQRGGKQTRTADGCLTDSQKQHVHTQLDRAPWKIEHRHIACRMRTLFQTAYSAAGKPVFTAVTCGNDRLDDVSAEVVADLSATLDAAINPKPPCCKS